MDCFWAIGDEPIWGQRGISAAAKLPDPSMGNQLSNIRQGTTTVCFCNLSGPLPLYKFWLGIKICLGHSSARRSGAPNCVHLVGKSRYNPFCGGNGEKWTRNIVQRVLLNRAFPDTALFELVLFSLQEVCLLLVVRP